MSMSSSDVYGNNILQTGLGPILDRTESLKRMMVLPPFPVDCSTIPRHIRLHHLMTVRDLYIPSTESGRVVETIDLMIRQGYRYRDPHQAEAWRLISHELLPSGRRRAPAMAAVVVGHSGVGKTETIRRTLEQYPQVLPHNSFPQIIGPHRQVTWISVDVPSSGRSSDLAANLMYAWDEAMALFDPKLGTRFTAALSASRRDGQKMLDEWRQVAMTHFLGILHLDEVQNFFKLPSLKSRRARTATGESELSIVEDQALRWILSLTNTWQTPVLMSGTPDGVGALTRRLSNTQRFVTSGYHHMQPFSGPDCPMFKDVFFPQLIKYQWLKFPLRESDELRKEVINLTAGIPRLIIALWVAAQRMALERSDDVLRLDDLKTASSHFLRPVQPAVQALRSGDPKLMSRYEDLVRVDDGFWEQFWSVS